LLERRLVVADDRGVREQHGAGLAFDEPARGPDRVPESLRRLLLDVHDVDPVAQLVDPGEDGEKIIPSALLQVVLQLDRAVEVVDDGPLSAAGDHDHLLDAAGDRLFDAVLDRRLVDQRQHLFGLGLRRRQEARAETGGRKYRLAYRSGRHKRQSIWWTRSKASGQASRAGWNVSWRATC